MNERGGTGSLSHSDRIPRNRFRAVLIISGYLYAWILSQFSDHDLSRLLFKTVTGQDNVREIFPHGTCFGTPKLTLIMLLVRDRYPDKPSPAFDRVWIEGGIDANLCDGMFAIFDGQRKDELKKLKEEERAKGGEATDAETSRSVEILREVQELSSNFRSSDASRSQEASQLSDFIVTLQQKLEELSHSIPLARAAISHADWTSISGSDISDDTVSGHEGEAGA